MNWITLGGLLFICAGAAFVSAYGAVRRRERTRLILSVLIGLPLAYASIASLWRGTQNPDAGRVFGTSSFGPDWACRVGTYGVCIKDLPAFLRPLQE